jgi:hypothetical protein
MRETTKGKNQMKNKPALRTSMNRAISTFLAPTYFDRIPLENLDRILREHGLALIQEDKTLWSGMLCGDEAHCLFDVGVYHEGMGSDELLEATKFVLALSWYRMGSGRFEVISYIS